MANDDKTEAPTPKRLRESREEGKVAKSVELNGAGVMAAGLIGVLVMGGAFVRQSGSAMQDIFSEISRPGNIVSGAGLDGLFHLVETTLLKTVAPVAGLCVGVGLLLNVVQVGLRFTPKAVTPKWSKINPAAGAKNLFGKRLAFETGKALTKVAVVGAVVALALIPDLTHMGTGVGTTPEALGLLIKHGATGIALRASGCYLLIGVVDYAWQRRTLGKSLKMTKQEVRDEFKQHQLPPEVRQALRRRQTQAAKARMMAAVPRADVVVTNPTHFAVALEYNGDYPAPVVIAKGQDNVALSIRRIAEENDIPIVENPPLARALHKNVALDQMISADLYQAVAEVLAYVYRLAARRKVGI